MEDNQIALKKRYKTYLHDQNVEIPQSTARYRLKKSQESSSSSSESEVDDTTSDDITLNPGNIVDSDTSLNNIDHCINEKSNSDVSMTNQNEVEDFHSDSELPDEFEENHEDHSTDSDDEENDLNIDDFDDLNFFHDSASDTSNDDSYEGNIDIDHDSEDECRSLLYETSNISRKESELLNMAIALRHSLPDIGLENMLRLIDCHLPQTVYKSKYKFLKKFPNSQFIKYFYCDDCATILHLDKDCATCMYCNKSYSKNFLETQGHYFIYIPLRQQLEELLNSDMYDHLRQESEENDIINGSIYKQMRRENIIADNDISIQFNIDGVSLSKSSKMSLWPIQVGINELDYRRRKNNVILCGLWYGITKPHMNIYLEPFVVELNELAKEGFQCSTFRQKQPITIKVHTLLSSIDSVARPMVQNMKQFNGIYGCSYCLHKGEQVTTNRGYTRVYPYKNSIARSGADHSEYVKAAVESQNVIKGVKGPSITALIPRFDIIHSFPPDYMHSCLLGVAKLFVRSWFDSKNNNERFYIGTKLKEFDDKLLRIKPPHELTRTPRSVCDKYKANEWKNFVLYYSICCLKGIMPEKYIKHWHLFVYGLNIFLKLKISNEEFKLAEKAFQKFVQDIETLYGRSFMKYNVHLLTHIPVYVKLYGSLWAWSTFPYEHFNGVMKFLFHGTQYIPEQICKSYNRLRFIKNNVHIFSHPDCSKKVVNLFIKVMSQCRVVNCIEYDNSLRVFGKPKRMKLSLTQKIVIEERLGERVMDECLSYQRFIHNHVLFHTCTYKRLKKRNNSVVLMIDNKVIILQHLLKLHSIISNSDKYLIMGTNVILMNENLCENQNFNSKIYSFIGKKTETIECYDISAIKSKCVCVENKEDTSSIFPIVNVVETD